jgi:hypothetical protein
MSRRSLGERALRIALGKLGEREQGGANCGPIVRWSLQGCMRDGQRLGIPEGIAWCAGFAGACEIEAAFPGEALPAHRGAVHELVSDARAEGMFREVEGYTPSPGDLAIFKRSGKDPRRGEEGHVGRVLEAPDGAGRFKTIDGNAGDAVREVERCLAVAPDGEELVGWIVRTGPAFVFTPAMLTPEERGQVMNAVEQSLDTAARGICG